MVVIGMTLVPVGSPKSVIVTPGFPSPGSLLLDVDAVNVAPLALAVVRVESIPPVTDALFVDFGSGTVLPVNEALNTDHEERADEGMGPTL